MNNCEIGGCPSKGPTICPTCKHWTPSRSSKYYYCTRYIAGRVTCDLPKGSCKECPFYDGPGEKGRSNLSGVDWANKEDVKKYARERMQEIRKRRRDAARRRKYGISSMFSCDGRSTDDRGDPDGNGIRNIQNSGNVDSELQGPSLNSMLRFEGKLEEKEGREI